MLVIYALIQLIFLYVFADRHVKNYKYYCLEVIKLSILTCFLNLRKYVPCFTNDCVVGYGFYMDGIMMS